MSGKKSVYVSVVDSDIFEELLKYVETLIEILSEYDLSEENRRKLNAVSVNIPDIIKEDE